MNRKMRAKLNNKIAKAKKERRSCPNEGQLVVTNPEQTKCDNCGSELVPVIGVAIVDDVPDRARMH